MGTKSENGVGGIPSIKSVKKLHDYDTYFDGIRDNREITNNPNPFDPKDRNAQANGDDFIDLESFLYSLTQNR